MTLTRILLASTAISLAGLGSSHAAPFALASTLAPARPAEVQFLTQVQLGVADAQVRLEEALARKAEAEASGGDVAAAQAEVDAAQADLEAAQAAVEGEVETQVTPPAEPEPAEPAPAEAGTAPAAEAAPEQTEQPAASGEAPQPEAGAAAEGSADTEPTGEPAPEAEQPATDSSSSQPVPETAPEAQAAPAEEAAPEEPTAPQSASEEPASAPEAEAPAQPATSTEPEPAAPADPEPAATTQTEPEPQATDQDATAETNQSGEATSTSSEEAPAEPMTEQSPAADPSAESPEAESPEKPAEEAQSSPEATQGAQDAEVLTLPVEDGAPVLDSAKEELPAPAEGEATQSAAPAASEPAAPPPTSDAEAQGSTAESQPAPKAFAETGERTTERPQPEVQTNVTIVNQYDNRTIIEVDNRTIVDHDERDRLRQGSSEVYYERLRGGRVREVIVRPNGVKLVTVTNRWGDVIQRSRVMPNGEEYVLFYAEANSDGSRDAFVDPGRRLPPLRLSIPVDDYILDATDAEPSAFLEFLMEPPVEQVERLYSVEEVRRSARIRDKVRRIDMDSLTFEFGKATISEDQVQRLSDVAAAMERILRRNPAETFLIEGHTDAVGTDEANLLLSDRRAETIAVALSDVFGIPPENLITQGYGERYLKVRTEEPERLNRRVTIRRITPLVTPVASR